MVSRRSLLTAAALTLPALAGCIDFQSPTRRPGGASRTDAPMGPGGGAGPGSGTGPYDPDSMPYDPDSMPYDPDSMPYDPDSMPHDPDSMPHDPGTGPYGPGMHDGPGGHMYPSGTPADDDAAPDESLDAWFADVDNYGGVEDRTGAAEVRVAVGAPGNGGAFAFGSPAVRVSPGTRVVWEWTGNGGYHDVVAVDGAFGSDLIGERGRTFAVAFPDAGVYRYVCTPHRSLGMKGAVLVE